MQGTGLATLRRARRRCGWCRLWCGLVFAWVLVLTLQTQTHAACVLSGSEGVPALTLPGDVLTPLYRLPDGRSALAVTRSGWVLRLDLPAGTISAQRRVSQRVQASAISATVNLPTVLAIVGAQPAALVFLDEDLKLLRTLALSDATGRSLGSALGIATAPSRQSFVVTLKDVPELWEVSYNPHAPEIAQGWVHDFQYREGQFVPGYLNPQRSKLGRLMVDFALTDDGHEVLIRHSDGAVQVLHLDVRRQVAAMAVPPWPTRPTPATPPWVCAGAAP